MATTPKNRKSWDEKTKVETATAILRGKLTFDEAVKNLDIQPYQLYAWIGQLKLAEATAAAATAGDGEDPHADTQIVREMIAAGLSGSPPTEIAERQIVEWYIRKYVMRAK